MIHNQWFGEMQLLARQQLSINGLPPSWIRILNVKRQLFKRKMLQKHLPSWFKALEIGFEVTCFVKQASNLSPCFLPKKHWHRVEASEYVETRERFAQFWPHYSNNSWHIYVCCSSLLTAFDKHGMKPFNVKETTNTSWSSHLITIALYPAAAAFTAWRNTLVSASQSPPQVLRWHMHEYFQAWNLIIRRQDRLL